MHFSIFGTKSLTNRKGATQRWFNVALGMWLLVAPVVLRYEPLYIGVRSSVIGLAIMGLSCIEGTKRERLGGGWSNLWSKRTGSVASRFGRSTRR